VAAGLYNAYVRAGQTENARETSSAEPLTQTPHKIKGQNMVWTHFWNKVL